MSQEVIKQRIATPGGEVVLQSERDHSSYEGWHYAPARRAGDYVYVSGVIVSRLPEGPYTPETFKTAMRRVFEGLRSQLHAYGASFADVALINTFHDWSAREFNGDRRAQAEAFKSVKAEFIPAPHPAWTAVGTSGLILPDGILEIQVIAYSPARS